MLIAFALFSMMALVLHVVFAVLSWRLYGAMVLLAQSGCALVWAQHLHASARPDYHDGVASTQGILLFVLGWFCMTVASALASALVLLLARGRAPAPHTLPPGRPAPSGVRPAGGVR